MSGSYRAHFGFKHEPFSSDMAAKDLLKLPDMVAVRERMSYALSIGGLMLVTGEVGSGKSTSLRYATGSFHQSQVLTLSIVGQSGSNIELLKMISGAIGIDVTTNSRAKLLTEMRDALTEITAAKKQQVLLVIDEANILRHDVFAELHNLTQTDFDSRSLITLVLCGQDSLLDRLKARSSAPLASRVIAISRLSPLTRARLDEYVLHHLEVAGMKKKLFDEQALTAIYQGFAGILRKTNALARGGLVAAATEQKDTVTAEHIRIASSELL